MVKRVTGRQGFLYRNAGDRSIERFAGGEVLTKVRYPDKNGIMTCLMHDQCGTKPIEITRECCDIVEYPDVTPRQYGVVRRYLFSVTRAFSRLLNASIGGWSGETLSGRAFREDIGWLRYLLDTVWFYIDSEENHCLECYLLDVSHGDYPERTLNWPRNVPGDAASK